MFRPTRSVTPESSRILCGMSNVRTLLSILVSGMTGAASIYISQSCGGEITAGYDDAGNYHTGDGAVWTRGAMCTGFDASHYLEDGGLDCDPTSGTQECTPWLVPPSLDPALNTYGFARTCQQPPVVDDAGHPALDDAGNPILQDGGECGLLTPAPSQPLPPGFRYPTNPTCPSPYTDAGADFCSGYYNQFVTEGRVVASCSGPLSGPGICYPTPVHGPIDCQAAGNFAVTVALDDGAVVCRNPCQP